MRGAGPVGAEVAEPEPGGVGTGADPPAVAQAGDAVDVSGHCPGQQV